MPVALRIGQSDPLIQLAFLANAVLGLDEFLCELAIDEDDLVHRIADLAADAGLVHRHLHIEVAVPDLHKGGQQSLTVEGLWIL